MVFVTFWCDDAVSGGCFPAVSNWPTKSEVSAAGKLIRYGKTATTEKCFVLHYMNWLKYRRKRATEEQKSTNRHFLNPHNHQLTQQQQPYTLTTLTTTTTTHQQYTNKNGTTIKKQRLEHCQQ